MKVNNSSLQPGLIYATAFSVFTFCASAQAALKTIEHSGVMPFGSTLSDMNGSTDVGNSPFTFIATFDTADITSFTNGFNVNHQSAAIRLGTELLGITDNTRTFVINSPNTLVGFAVPGSGNDLFMGPFDSSFGSYDLSTGFGPIESKFGLIANYWRNNPLNLIDGGMLQAGDDNSPSASYQASATVSLPSSAILFASGVGLLITALRTRRAQKIRRVHRITLLAVQEDANV